MSAITALMGKYKKLSAEDAEGIINEATAKGVSPDDIINSRNKDVGKEYFSNAFDTALNIAGGAAGMAEAANLSDPGQTSLGTGAMAGAIQGVAGGAALGPVGMVAGGLLGGIKGLVGAGNAKAAFAQSEYDKRMNLLKGMRVAPVMNEEGGMNATESGIDVPLQTEAGEVMLMEGGDLVDVNAKKKHKDMKKGEITDIVPSGTYTFSDSNKRLINLEKIKDHIVGYGKGKYKEGEANVPLKKIHVSDILGDKGKITPAEGARRLRNKYKVDLSDKTPIGKATNKENKINRLLPLQILSQLQEKVYDGKKENVKNIYETGGFVGGGI